MHKKPLLFPIILIVFAYSSGFVFVAAPVAENNRGSERFISGSKVKLFHAAQKILIIQGFALNKTDENNGELKTKVSPMRLAVDDCECGLNMGLVKDTRPIINVDVDVKIKENNISIKAKIHGDYPQDQVTEEMIESDLLDQISRYLD